MHAAQNYIYILFAVAYMVYTIIKAGKKVKQNGSTIDKQPQASPTVQPPATSSKPDMQGEMKKMLEDLLGVPTSDPTLPRRQAGPVPAERKTEVAKPQSSKTILQTPPKNKTEIAREKLLAAHAKTNSDILSHAKQPKAVKKVFAETTEAEEPVMDFDIRQAIIFSEILKRPEY